MTDFFIKMQKSWTSLLTQTPQNNSTNSTSGVEDHEEMLKS